MRHGLGCWCETSSTFPGSDRELGFAPVITARVFCNPGLISNPEPIELPLSKASPHKNGHFLPCGPIGTRLHVQPALGAFSKLVVDFSTKPTAALLYSDCASNTKALSLKPARQNQGYCSARMGTCGLARPRTWRVVGPYIYEPHFHPMCMRLDLICSGSCGLCTLLLCTSPLIHTTSIFGLLVSDTVISLDLFKSDRLFG